MSTYSYLYRRPDMKESNAKSSKKEFVNIHLLIGYTANNLAAFNEMADTITKAFPFVQRKDIQFGQVTKSSYCNGFTIARWHGMMPKKFRVPKLWSVQANMDGNNCEYCCS